MLRKVDKALMVVVSVIAMILGVLTCVPFRTFSDAENIYVIEAILKFVVFPVVAIILGLLPCCIKYGQLVNREERSKTANVLSYLPALIEAAGLLVFTCHTLCYAEHPMADVSHAILVVMTVAYLTFILCAIKPLADYEMKLSKKGTLICDCAVFVVLLIVALLSWRITSTYNAAYAADAAFHQGDAFLFVLYIALFFVFVFGLGKLIKMIKSDETVVYAAKMTEKELDALVMEQYENAYNDVLDDFEEYFDETMYDEEDEEAEEVVEEVQPEEVEEAAEEVTEEVQPEEATEEPAEEEQPEEDEEEIEEVVEEESEVVYEVDPEVSEKIKQLESDIDAGKAGLQSDREELDAYVAQTQAEIEALRQQVAEFEVAEEPEEVEEAPVEVKKKVLKPTFEQIATFAKSLQEEDWKIVDKIDPATGTGTIKFTMGKVQFLILQATTSDYRITFLATEKKWSQLLTSSKAINVPKNAKGNNWLKFVNKGTAETGMVKGLIRESVKGAKEEIERIAKAKEEEKARKAAERKAAKAAEQASEAAAE